MVFVPGNYDESIRKFINVNFGGVKVGDALIPTTAVGKYMPMLHGDRSDRVSPLAHGWPISATAHTR